MTTTTSKKITRTNWRKRLKSQNFESPSSPTSSSRSSAWCWPTWQCKTWCWIRLAGSISTLAVNNFQITIATPYCDFFLSDYYNNNNNKYNDDNVESFSNYSSNFKNLKIYSQIVLIWKNVNSLEGHFKKAPREENARGQWAGHPCHIADRPIKSSFCE